jgi:hypothetical protein
MKLNSFSCSVDSETHNITPRVPDAAADDERSTGGR